MIVRILNEGQWQLTEDAVRGLNSFDDAVEQAVTTEWFGPFSPCAIET